MFKIINILCLVCIVALISDIMIYFCKDAINIFNQSVRGSNSTGVSKGNIRKSNSYGNTYSYDNKIAK